MSERLSGEGRKEGRRERRKEGRKERRQIIPVGKVVVFERFSGEGRDDDLGIALQLFSQPFKIRIAPSYRRLLPKRSSEIPLEMIIQ